MRCPSCSSAVADGRRFCPSCGTPVAAPVGAGARVGAASGGGTPSPTGGRPAPAAPFGQSGSSGQPTQATHSQTAQAAQATQRGDETSATAAIVLPDAGHAPPAETQDGTTQMLPVETDHEAGRAPHGGSAVADAGAAIGRAGDAVRRHAGRAADRFGAAPLEVRIAMVGAAVTVLAFLALPYSDNTGTGIDVGGRLWWRPIAAIVATVLLATTLRARPNGQPGDAPRAGGTVDRLLAALVIATIGATEAGLVGLFSGDTSRVRVGYYFILAGLVTVLVAAARAARRRCAA